MNGLSHTNTSRPVLDVVNRDCRVLRPVMQPLQQSAACVRHVDSGRPRGHEVVKLLLDVLTQLRDGREAALIDLSNEAQNTDHRDGWSTTYLARHTN